MYFIFKLIFMDRLSFNITPSFKASRRCRHFPLLDHDGWWESRVHNVTILAPASPLPKVPHPALRAQRALSFT